MRATPGATPYTRYQSFLPRARFLARESYFYSRRLLFGASACPSTQRPTSAQVADESALRSDHSLPSSRE